MRKGAKGILAIIGICICVVLSVFISADPAVSMVVSNCVEGKAGDTILDQIVSLSFTDPDEFSFNTTSLSAEQDITSWFTNRPANTNLVAKVQSVSESEIKVRFSGSIDSSATVGETNIEVCIPNSESISYITKKFNSMPVQEPVDSFNNASAKYIITEYDNVVIEYDGPYTISGTVGEAIVPQTIGVEISSGGDEFDLSIENVELPTVNGLTPKVIYADVMGMQITIEYTGTPLAPSTDLIHTTIDGTYLLQGITRHVPDRNDVKFNIAPKQNNNPTPTPTPAKNPETRFQVPITGID